ncbi:secreted RxLR effector peptide protein, putative [Phytophthora infestans T30-4]|uniref:Secreted RxLR effector peptide protein, putative n=2 Tax=Phytophthora infestans TaxID=4787 RepID=D0NPH0_PHYIT|nr:secreted RxLR effector peptide protein, putative [Phytophthora infestans T30-4]KAF4033462.1 WYL domain [Phytophthora infestans]EEY62512.1 secreted RxLR effector peptide protein, putative [Phytophthora infestans T30-4]KAF4143034.1 WYL domain [Phytophthora infestans]KAI9984630.1 hypothetical protein PInf_005991 [Phytophthora infestans]KAI9984660.1 hypothetical protein PInf_006021 [Phytophthora infestans]|eukprot:XP_002899148.1 secreted RxLR effector peptide protein, putative [Phytophthora infestans T30-4]
MRISYALAVTVATLLVPSNALVSSKPAMLSPPEEPSQRHLRSHDTPVLVDDYNADEERGLDNAKMKSMWKDGWSADNYATKLGIADDIAHAETSTGALQQLMQTHKYEKYKTYLNYLITKNKKKQPNLVYYS